MTLRLKNWKLAILALVAISFFTALGCWQLSRAQKKTILLQSFADRTAKAPLISADINPPNDWRFYRSQLKGEFDNAHTLLLDNKTFEGRIGYEVYTPFKAIGLSHPILVDRGFIPLGYSRKELPLIKPITGIVSILGMLNVPPTYVAFGQIKESIYTTWPLRIEFIQLNDLAHLLGYSLYPYVLNISPTDPAAYAVKWQVVIMGPERHRGYAVQWFAFALTLLILFVALGIKLEYRTMPKIQV